jgi:hypothetical protein
VDSDADSDFGERSDPAGDDGAPPKQRRRRRSRSSSRSSSGSSSSSASEHAPPIPLSRLAPLRAAIDAAIKELGGAVFPKLNWTAPVDAVHMIAAGGEPRCTDAGQVLMLLGASDLAMHDLGTGWAQVSSPSAAGGEPARPDASESAAGSAATDAAPVVERYTLVLRRWTEMPRAGEFRCFVRAGVPIAVCQRHHDTFYPSLAAAAETDGPAIAARVARFARNAVCGVFPLDDFVLDVYLGGRDAVKIVDFAPWVRETDPLMFTWGELTSEAWLARVRDGKRGGAGDGGAGDTTGTPKPAGSSSGRVPPMWRWVTSQGNVRPSRTVYNAFPIETMVQDADALVDMLRELKQG